MASTDPAGHDHRSETALPLGITLWYGSRQIFGVPGIPQRWVNVLGCVQGPATLLTCRINDDPPQPLSLGPDGLRLREPGDFNAEIPVDRLRPGDNAIRLEALDADGCSTHTDAVIHWRPGNTWPLPCAIDWPAHPCPGRPAAITDRVWIVDGRWRRDGGGIRPALAAYDRLVALGDMTWADYRVRVHAAIHGFEPNIKHPDRLRGGLGILVRWTGHHHDAHQPHREWRPNGAIAWYRTNWEHGSTLREFNISDAVLEDRAKVSSPPCDLPPGQAVLLDFSVRSRPGRTSVYHFTAAPAHHPDQPFCDLTAEGTEGEAPTGSILLIALHCDVTLGRIQVDPLA